MKILEATAAAIIFPPHVIVNENPTGIHDKLTGYGSGQFNDILKYSRINATIIPAKSMGFCSYSVEAKGPACTGLVSLIQTGEANFSLMTIPKSFDPRLNKVPYNGLFVPAEEMQHFMSPATTNQTETELNLMSTATMFDRKLMLFYYLTFLSLILLMCWSKEKGTFVKKIRWIQVYAMTLNIPSGKIFRFWHRRCALFFAVYLSHMYYQLYLGSTQTALVLNEPERFPETLEDVLNSGLDIHIYKGLTIEMEFEISQDPVKKELLRKSIRTPFSTDSAISSLADRMLGMKTISLFNSQVFALSVKGLMCIQTECELDKSFKISEQFGVSAPILATSRSVDPVVQERFLTANLMLAGSGVFALEKNDIFNKFHPIVASFEGKFRRCVLDLDKTIASNIDSVSAIRLHAFLYWPSIAVTSMIICFTCLFLETWRKRMRKQRMR